MIKGAVLGAPIAHSLSPLLHNGAYLYLGIAGEYSKFEVASGELTGFLKNHPELSALSLTMPLKEEALSVTTNISDIARQVSGGNTLYQIGQEWHLTSTDVVGFSNACSFNDVNLTGSVLIIGAGATARAVVAACAGVSDEIHVISRKSQREESIRKAGLGREIIFHAWAETKLINQADVVVNTTPERAANFFTDSVEHPVGLFFEVLYSPIQTEMMTAWQGFGGPTIDGLELLIHQAISQVEIFSKSRVDRLALAKHLRVMALKYIS